MDCPMVKKRKGRHNPNRHKNFSNLFAFFSLQLLNSLRSSMTSTTHDIMLDFWSNRKKIEESYRHKSMDDSLPRPQP